MIKYAFKKRFSQRRWKKIHHSGDGWCSFSHRNVLHPSSYYLLCRNSDKGFRLWAWTCAPVGEHHIAQECVGSLKHISTKYKQLARATFNLIDNVWKNNTAYFGCGASKLTMMTFCWGGLWLWRRARWKGIKKMGEKWNKRLLAAGMKRIGASWA